MKKKLSVSQKRLLLCLVIVIIFMSAYQFIYTKYENMAENYIAQTQLANQQIAQSKTDLAQEDTLTKETKEVTSKIDDIITAFPVKLTKEDNLVFIQNLEKALGIDIPSVDVSDPSEFYKTILPIRNETGFDMIVLPAASSDTTVTTSDSSTPDAGTITDGSTSTDTTTSNNQTTDLSAQVMKGLVCPISISFKITEEKFIKLLDYINTYPERTSIADTSLSYDSSTGELICNMTINRYVLIGSGKDYQEPDIGDISIGTDSLFGTSTETQK